MKHFSRKIKYTLIVLLITLVVFIGFSKAGILFSDNNRNVVTVSTQKKTFDPNNYVASVAMITSKTVVSTTEIKYSAETTTSTSKQETTTIPTTTAGVWQGIVLSKSKGTVMGPSGKETYYNLNMTGIVNNMRKLGYSEENYPYWVREDGVKMLGDYVMVAANYEIRPKGTLVESSLGMAIVCDTGGFAKRNPEQIDIAVTWK